jgi:hypothetical protein
MPGVMRKNEKYRKFLGDEGVNWFLSGPSDEYMTETEPLFDEASNAYKLIFLKKA